MKPPASVLWPVRPPSTGTMVLTAPMASASAESPFRWGMTASLYGMVTLAPLMPRGAETANRVPDRIRVYRKRDIDRVPAMLLEHGIVHGR